MAAVLESDCLQAALEYAAQGLLVVPVRRGEKKPWLHEWERNASDDPSIIEGWWDREPNSNVGIRLGKLSNIIDIECDDAEAEKKLTQLFNGVEIVTATYIGKRGKHRLFRWSEHLPFSHKPWFKFGALEFRTGNDKGAQSVFPPSIHPDGDQYKWLVTIDDGGIAELPDHVIARLWNWVDGDPEAEISGKAKKTREEWQRITEGGKSEGQGRNDDATVYIGGLLRMMPTLDDSSNMELVYQSALALNLKNRQPLEEEEFRRTFKSILKREQERRVSESADNLVSRPPQSVVDSKGGSKIKVPEGWKLVIVLDDPPTYELYSPLFHESRGSCIRLTARQFNNFREVQDAASEQAFYPLPDEIAKAWRARGGLREQLMFAAERREASTITKRLATAAEYLLGKLNAATVRANGKDEPDVRKPIRMADGEVWFRWNETWRDAVFDGMVHKDEPRKLADAVGIGPACARMWPPRGSSRRRYVVFGKELMSKLRKLAEADDE